MTLTTIIAANVDPRAGAVRASDVAALAARQDGVVARAQLLRAGAAPHEVDYAVKAGRLIVLYRGVYAVGHTALTLRGRVRAALLAAGRFAVASHLTAAALHVLIASLPAVLDVRLTRGDRRSRPGLKVHHGTTAWTYVDGLPVTTPLQTLHDLGYPDRITREALARGLVRPRDLPDDGPAATRSELERRMLALIHAAGLPAPLVNHPLGPYVLDFVWPEPRLIVETDGWATHGHFAAFEEDRARDAHLAAAGYVVLRFTWRQVTEEPVLVVSRIAQAAARSPRASKSSV